MEGNAKSVQRQPSRTTQSTASAVTPLSALIPAPPTTPNITYHWLEVGPALATEWLKEVNLNNRPIMDTHVNRIAADITAGRYVPTHQGIAFDTAGNLIDGQHRLSAIVKASVPIMLLVARNVPVAARPKIDSGKTRSLAHVLEMSYGVKDGKDKAAWVAAIVRMLEGTARKLSDGEAMDLIARYSSGIDWATGAFTIHRKGICRASVVGALVYGQPTNPAKTDEFAKQLLSGERLERGSPVLPLREFLLGAVHRKDDSERDTSLHVLNALEAYVIGETRVLTRASERSLAFFGRAYAKKK